jgi:hypothetical protein
MHKHDQRKEAMSNPTVQPRTYAQQIANTGASDKTRSKGKRQALVLPKSVDNFRFTWSASNSSAVGVANTSVTEAFAPPPDAAANPRANAAATSADTSSPSAVASASVAILNL